MIHIENLKYGYSRKKTVFDQLSLDLPAGNIYGLLGENGAGKSTLMKIMAGLLFPTEGKIQIEGFTPKERNPLFLQEVYLVPEEFYVPEMNATSFVELYSPFYPRFNHAQLHACLAEFQLPSDQNLSTLSYGQKKKFILSFGIATDSKLLILDEPTNGLDIPSKSQFRKVLANAINEERTFIVSTHQVRDMETLIDPIIILNQGKIVFCQSTETISQKLSISKLKELPKDALVLYAEPTFGGYTVVTANESSLDSKLNLEILFNAVINSTEKINNLFQN